MVMRGVHQRDDATAQRVTRPAHRIARQVREHGLHERFDLLREASPGIPASVLTGHAVLGTLVAAAMWRGPDHAYLLTWAGLLALAMLVAWMLASGRTGRPTGRRRTQAGWLLISLAWALGGALLLPQAAPVQWGALAVLLPLLAVGSLIVAARDPAAPALALRNPERPAELADTSRQLELRTLELQTTLDIMAQGIVSEDAQRRVRFCNQRALELLEMPPEVLHAGADIEDLIVYQTQRGEINADGSVVDVQDRNGLTVSDIDATSTDYVRRTRAGRMLEVRVRKVPGGGYVRTYSDVTAYAHTQMALRNSEAEMRALLEAFPGYISAVDQNGIYTYCNERLAERLGRRQEDIIGHHGLEVLGDTRFRINEADVVRARSGTPVSAERHYPAFADHEAIDLEVNHVAGPLQADGGQICYAFGIDVTARKRAQTQLIAARLQAEQANQAKSAFLANMSHEIRTPMNAILGLNHLMRRAAATPQQAERLAQIDTAGQHLMSIINNVLDLSKIEAGGVTLETATFEVGAVLRNVAELTAESAHAKGLSVVAVAPASALWVRGDPTRLRQALLNYAGNAIKFTEQGTVTLESTVQQDGGDEWLLIRFSVTDTGVGIAPDDQKRIFEIFEQADASTSRKFGGTGLGLAITRRLVQLMGGDVGVESTPGAGSCFWFTARLLRAEGASPGAAAVDAGDAERRLRTSHAGARVLIVEDNEVNRLIVREMLVGLDLTVDTATDGYGALTAARARRYDLILMDLQMPGIDGLEATRRLRALPGGSSTPIVALTANVFDEDRRACEDAGMNDFLAKPIDARALHACALKWLDGPAPANAAADCPAVAASAGSPPLQEMAASSPPLHEMAAPDQALRDRLANNAGVDWEHGVSLMGGRVDKYLGLLALLIEQHGGDMQRLRALLDGEDPMAVRRLTHSLYGAAAMLGAQGVAQSVLLLQNALRAASANTTGRAAVRERIAEVEGQFQVLTEALAVGGTVPQDPEQPPQAVNPVP